MSGQQTAPFMISDGRNVEYRYWNIHWEQNQFKRPSHELDLLSAAMPCTVICCRHGLWAIMPGDILRGNLKRPLVAGNSKTSSGNEQSFFFGHADPACQCVFLLRVPFQQGTWLRNWALVYFVYLPSEHQAVRTELNSILTYAYNLPLHRPSYSTDLWCTNMQFVTMVQARTKPFTTVLYMFCVPW